ncbi:unnamed protein product [Blepharisma stoltei]|uniref:Uncharacterized protein n=1 Tax=Blepharisma stoltei TaxID=1481888 RepID=A0AAU9K2G7_9CILI|nr:unnamed protein product [Blepharisma stoltei]
MEGSTALWIIIWFVSSAACYLYGMHVESNLNPKSKPKYSELKREEEKSETQESSDEKHYREELNKERASKKKMTQDYEQEIDSLKAQIAFVQEQTKAKLKNREEEVFEEEAGFGVPTVQIVEGSYDNFDEELNKELNNEI